MTPFTYQRGETISLALDAVRGDPATVTSVTAQMKALATGRNSVDPLTPVAASFAVTGRIASGDIPAGWTLTIDAATSSGLSSGNYLTDARLSIGGGVVITECVAIRIRDAVTT